MNGKVLINLVVVFLFGIRLLKADSVAMDMISVVMILTFSVIASLQYEEKPLMIVNVKGDENHEKQEI